MNSQGWEQFTDAVIDALVKRHSTSLVFLLWGNDARSKAKKIDQVWPEFCLSVNQTILTSPPLPVAPLGPAVCAPVAHVGDGILGSAEACSPLAPPDLSPSPGNKHFSKANAYLKSKGRPEIKWDSVCQPGADKVVPLLE